MKLFNTLTRRKEEFIPLTPSEVKMYACGPTVYNYFHVGNARPFIVFDLLRRYLEYRGYRVTFVQNFTDIDDKVIRKANEEGTDFHTIAERYIQEYYTDAAGLGIGKATVHPRATESMEAITAFAAYKQKFIQAIDDDLNTADALSAVFELTREINGWMSAHDDASKAFLIAVHALFMELTGVLNLAQTCDKEEADADTEKIETLIAERAAAKKAKDFAIADRIRDELTAMGVTIKDTRQGTQWSRA